MRKYTFIGILILMAGLGAACEDQLNALPGQSKVEGNVILDQKTAEVALNGVYYRFADGGDDRGTPSTMWASSHEISPGLLTGYIRYPYGSVAMEENSSLTANDYSVANLWSGSYKIINAANGVIKQIAEVDDNEFVGDRKNEIIAEARWLRAYGHYNLLRYFAQFYDQKSKYGVLLRKEFVTATNIAQARSSVKASYDCILEDLDFAERYAPDENRNIYVNQWVAKGLKARVLMMRGTEGDYEKVITLTKDIIEKGPYELEENLKDIFKEKGLASKEVMLGIEPFVNQVRHYDDYAYREKPAYLRTTTDTLLYENDPRGEWMRGAIGEGEGITKYLGNQVEVCYAMRLTEMYLLQAEAIVRSGGLLSDAKALLKEVMGHAGITVFTELDAISDRDELLFEIYKETARNLMLEDGIEWSALIRLPMERILEVKPAIREQNYIILPIPADEFEKNPVIGDQNPGYSKN